MKRLSFYQQKKRLSLYTQNNPCVYLLEITSQFIEVANDEHSMRFSESAWASAKGLGFQKAS